jgi:hypothetical protein
MKAKLVRERLDFDREGTPYEKIDIGHANKDNSVKSFLQEMKRIIEEGIDEGWDDFFNTGIDQIDNPEMKAAYTHFVENWEKYEPMMREVGISVEERPDMEETVFILV